MSKYKFIEIGEGYLYLGSNAQNTGKYHSDPVVKANRPPHGSGCDTSGLYQYDGTKFYQWMGRKSDGRFHPFGKILTRVKE